MKRSNTANQRVPQTTNNAQPKRWRICVLTLLCGVLIGAGFFFAGRQHFSSMDFSMKNSRLRKQIDDLESEKRRLLLAREVAQSPAEIKKAGKKAGLNEPAPTQAELARAFPVTNAKAIGTVAFPAKTPGIIKTAEVSPVRFSVAGTFTRPERIAKPTVKEIRAE